MRKIVNIVVPVVICFLVGWTASMFQASALHDWYPQLNKPGLTPPNLVFPLAWTILYICMGVSVGLVLNSHSPRKRGLVWLFAIQLFFNFTWSLFFFYLRSPLFALVNILILLALIIWYTCRSFKANIASSILFFPYILWACFATYLNAYIFWYN